MSENMAPAGGFAALVPEFVVTDLDVSLRFWCDALGFEIAYGRPASRFAFLQRGALQVMLFQRDGSWEVADLAKPFGRGINIQMTVDAVAPLLEALRIASWPVYEEVRDAWYEVGAEEKGQREFLVQDPDGYLLRFSENLGLRRPAVSEVESESR